MYSLEDKIRAVNLLIQYDQHYATVINELGYPSPEALRLWYEQYKKGLLSSKYSRKPKYTEEQKQAAIEYYMSHGKSIRSTIAHIGYGNPATLSQWLKEQRADCRNGDAMVKYSEGQIEELAAVIGQKKTSLDAAKACGVAPSTIKGWKKRILSDKGQSMSNNKKTVKQEKSTQNNDELQNLVKALSQQAVDLQKQNEQLRLENEVLQKANEILKKDVGVNCCNLTNREKTKVINALRKQYRLKSLLPVLSISKSSYCYHAKALVKEDKYHDLSQVVSDVFEESSGCYGYRRIHIRLRQIGIKVSEKVVRRLMRENNLQVTSLKIKKYSSYMGEITPPVENLVKRHFHADSPNKLWLTDLTEFHIPAGKVYLSPVIDCFDGMPVAWTIGTSPSSDLTNRMLSKAISTLKADEHPIVHSDRGSHYRWPRWIEIMNSAGLIRSMSKKGCSPDNSACEGFFGRLKNEMFYGKSWKSFTIEQFMQVLDDYMVWYCTSRIKLSLGGMSPVDYRRSLGLIP